MATTRETCRTRASEPEVRRDSEAVKAQARLWYKAKAAGDVSVIMKKDKSMDIVELGAENRSVDQSSEVFRELRREKDISPMGRKKVSLVKGSYIVGGVKLLDSGMDSRHAERQDLGKVLDLNETADRAKTQRETAIEKENAKRHTTMGCPDQQPLDKKTEALIRALKKRVQEDSERIKRLGLQLEESRSQVERLQSESKSATEREAALKVQMQTLACDAKKQRQEINSFVTTLDTEKKSKADEISKLRRELGEDFAARERKAETSQTAKIAQLESELAGVRKELDEARGKLPILLANEQEKAEALQRDRIGQLEVAAEAAKKESDETKEKLLTELTRYRSAAVEIVSLKFELERVKSENKESQEQAASELLKKAERITELESKLAAKERSRGIEQTLKEQLERKSMRIHELKVQSSVLIR